MFSLHAQPSLPLLSPLPPLVGIRSQLPLNFIFAYQLCRGRCNRNSYTACPSKGKKPDSGSGYQKRLRKIYKDRSPFSIAHFQFDDKNISSIITMPKNIEGIIAAVPTPLTADGKALDLENIKRQCDRYVESGLHGVLITGSTGEFPALSVDEHKQTIKTFIDAIAGRMSAIAGIGANSTDLAVELAQFSEKAGADAVMVAPPFYETLPWKALYQFYEEICGSVSIPVMYYNFPDGTGVKLTADQVRVLSKIKNLNYMKDSSGDQKELADLLTNPVEGFAVLNGWDSLTFYALSQGAQAAAWGVASVLPKECVELWDAFQENDIEKAKKLWVYLSEVCDFMDHVNYNAGIKAGHEIIGSSAGPVRKPNLPLEKEEYEKFSKILDKRVYKD